jgi:hypothetical protein
MGMKARKFVRSAWRGGTTTKPPKTARHANTPVEQMFEPSASTV